MWSRSRRAWPRWSNCKKSIEIARVKVPIISIIIGEGGSGGAIALACGDKVWALENSVYSILSPEGFASILLKDSSKAKEVAEIMGITSYDLLNKGIIEKIITGPSGGAQNDIKSVVKELKSSLIVEINNLKSLDINDLLEKDIIDIENFLIKYIFKEAS